MPDLQLPRFPPSHNRTKPFPLPIPRPRPTHYTS
jgi:hypothetical protein